MLYKTDWANGDIVKAEDINRIESNMEDLKLDQYEIIAGENILVSKEPQGKTIKISAEGGGNFIGSTPPEKTNLLWTDTSLGGVLKYFDGLKWVPLKSVWG